MTPQRHFLAVLALSLLAATASVHAQATRTELSAIITEHAAYLDSLNIPYNGHWSPPGGAPMRMDCSNTVRYLYGVGATYYLPRTASDQYEQLRKQRRVHRVNPKDKSWLNKLRPGDLLFWENTYRPKRKPPVTHVMIYLGRDAEGRMKMAGSQSSRGVGIYTFNPEVVYGGYNWFLWFKRPGKFTAFARPL
jgi:hypothetical protein